MGNNETVSLIKYREQTMGIAKAWQRYALFGCLLVHTATGGAKVGFFIFFLKLNI